MGGSNRKSAAAHRAEGTYRADRHGHEEPAPRIAPVDPVPRAPRGMAADEREVWADLAVAVADRFHLKFLPSFRVLVGLMVGLRRMPVDAPATARARAEQAALSALSRWGLDPSGDINLGPVEVPEPAPQKFYRLRDGTIGDDQQPEVRAAIAAGTAELLGHVDDTRNRASGN